MYDWARRWGPEYTTLLLLPSSRQLSNISKMEHLHGGKHHAGTDLRGYGTVRTVKRSLRSVGTEILQRVTAQQTSIDCMAGRTVSKLLSLPSSKA